MLLVKDNGNSGYLSVAAQGGELDNAHWLTAINDALETHDIFEDYVRKYEVKVWDYPKLLRLCKEDRIGKASKAKAQAAASGLKAFGPKAAA